VADFGRVFLMVKYTDITKCPKLNGYGNIYVPSYMVTECRIVTSIYLLCTG
jgi:hypothetical protein